MIFSKILVHCTYYILSIFLSPQHGLKVFKKISKIVHGVKNVVEGTESIVKGVVKVEKGVTKMSTGEVVLEKTEI